MKKKSKLKIISIKMYLECHYWKLDKYIKIIAKKKCTKCISLILKEDKLSTNPRNNI